MFPKDWLQNYLGMRADLLQDEEQRKSDGTSFSTYKCKPRSFLLAAPGQCKGGQATITARTARQPPSTMFIAITECQLRPPLLKVSLESCDSPSCAGCAPKRMGIGFAALDSVKECIASQRRYFRNRTRRVLTGGGPLCSLVVGSVIAG